jgi:hypothetical protein
LSISYRGTSIHSKVISSPAAPAGN